MRNKICSVCGKPSRGKVCRMCISANRKYKYTTCRDCGGPIHPSYTPRRCKSCSCKAIRKRNEGKHPKTAVCEYCGKEFPWSYRLLYVKAVYCSRSCSCRAHRYTQKHGPEHDKDELLSKLTAFIKSKGRYVTREELREEFHVSDKVYTRLHISIVELNKSLGYSFHQEYSDAVSELKRLISTGKYRNAVELREVMGDRYPKSVSVRRLFREAGVLWTTSRDPDKLKDEMVAYIKSIGHFVSLTGLIRKFHFDYDSTWVSNGFDLEKLHEQACVPFVHTYSYYENLAYKKLLEVFGESTIERQKTFSDLRSAKRWKLRYDFCIPSKHVLIEVDGTQHTPGHTLFRETTADNDRKKNEYAEKAGYVLYRIPTTPASSFEERLDIMINEIKERTFVKESELLES